MVGDARSWWAMVSDGCDSGAANEDYYDHRADRTDNIVTKVRHRYNRAQPAEPSVLSRPTTPAGSLVDGDRPRWAGVDVGNVFGACP